MEDMIAFREALLTVAAPLVGHVLKNIPNMKGGILLSRLQNKWDKRIPFIIVGAGPSLNKNIDQLKKVGNKACILCLDTAYLILKEKGIRPHIVCTLDAGKKIEVFGDMEKWDIPLGVIANARPEIIEKTSSSVIWCSEASEYVRTIRGEIGGEEELFPVAYGVSSLGLSIPISLGASQMVFVGMDMAYSEDKKSHAGVMEDDFDVPDLEETEGYYGKPVYTRTDWIRMRKWIEEIAAEDNYGRYINATEGGSKIKGVPQMSLEKAVSFLKEPEEDWLRVLDDPSVRMTDEEYASMMERYYQSFDDFDRICDMDYEDVFYNGTCNDMIILDLIKATMKSRPEETREERFGKAKEVLRERIDEIRGMRI